METSTKTALHEANWLPCCICFLFLKTSTPATQSAVDVQYSGESSTHSSGMHIDENEYAGKIMVEGPDAAKMPDIHFSPNIT